MIVKPSSLIIFFFYLLELFSGVVGERWRIPTKNWFGRFRGGATNIISNRQKQAGQRHNQQSFLRKDGSSLFQLRCGDNPGGGDEERYSRQVYTLGARAHGLIRSATVYIDGPAKSGLVYECAKNLALSGVGKIVILSSSDKLDAAYHSEELDDLGVTYRNGARAEIEDNEKTCAADVDLLKEYLHRLNPSLNVQVLPREVLNEDDCGHGILLCVDRPLDTKLRLNQLCRESGFPFVAAETAGVYGLAFSDFGPTFQVHDVDGETPLVIPLNRVEILESDEEDTLLVHCMDGERHDVSKGDEIQFQLATGESLEVTCTVTKVKSPQLISVRVALGKNSSIEDFVEKVNSEVSTFSRLKKIEEISFNPLDKAIADAKKDLSLFVPSDLDKSFDDTRRNAIFSCFLATNKFVKDFGRLPTVDDSQEFMEMAKNSWKSGESSEDSDWNKHCKIFSRICRAKFVPQQAIFGAIASQECLKAASGLYNPIRQFLLYDCDEVMMGGNSIDVNDKVVDETSGLSYIFGNEVTNLFRRKKIFVVGAGAIGCELLKNLAAMGAATTGKGKILVTDMDTIEPSNLSRQLLFRDADIGKFKSQAALEAIGRLNPSLKMECYVSRVGEDEQGPFDFKFWSKRVDVVLNALDNVEARLYIDSQCVANRIGLVDAGTLGSKGNVQVVVPHQTESYGSSADPPEPSIPVCTLKNFPYAISHTIQWGRDLFEGLFARRPRTNSDYLKLVASSGVDGLISRLEADFSSEQEVLDAAKEIKEDASALLSKHDGTLRDKCVSWAIEFADDLFNRKISELLEKHPIDSLDEDNEPFWSGSRKAPTPISYSANEELQQGDNQQTLVNRNYIDFVRSAARLRMEMFLGSEVVGTDEALISVDEAEAALKNAQKNKSNSANDADVSNIRDILGDLSPSEYDDDDTTQLQVAEFEKDDESNGHVLFITAASNLRAICYGIPPVDAMETRKVAGNIVPAMVTTTAFVSALSCIELFKLVQNNKNSNSNSLRSYYRNSFINLALPFFASTAPLPAEEIESLRGKTYTLWDRILIKESKKSAAANAGGMSLKQLLKRLKREVSQDSEGIEISSISYGPYMIYANFIHEDEKDYLKKNIWDLVASAVESGDEFDSAFSRESSKEDKDGKLLQKLKVIDLTVIAEDTESGEEAELPLVRVLRAETKG